MNYMFKTGVDTIPYESGRLYTFKKFKDGIYYRDLKSEIIKDVTINLADIPLKNGILRVDRINAKKPLDLILGHYSLPHINGYINTSVQKINNKEVHIIDNGIYQLALIPVKGWESITSKTTSDLHPEAKKSTVLNISTSYTPNQKNNELITAMLWKKSGKPFTKKELSIADDIQIKKKIRTLSFE